MKKPKKPKAKRPSLAPAGRGATSGHCAKAELGAAAVAFLSRGGEPALRASASRPHVKAAAHLAARHGTAALGTAARAFLKQSAPRSSLSSIRSAARSLSATLDQRELVTLLLLPFFLLAFALAMSQSWRHPVRTALEAPIGAHGGDPVAADAPATLAAPSVPPAPRAEPVAPAALPPPATVARAPVEITPPAIVALPAVPPVIEAPQIELATPAPVLPAEAPRIVLPEIALATPVPALPSAPPVIDVPQVELTAPVPVLPVEAPAIDRPAIAMAAPPTVIPAVPSPKMAPAPLPAIAAPSADAIPRVTGPDIVERPAPSLPTQREAKLAPPAPLPAEVPADGLRMCPVVPGFGKPAYAVRPVAEGEDFGERLAQAAREQTKEFVVYNDAYRRIAYPMGDVNPMYGVCTDVIIRAYRALGVDLQELIAKARVGSGDTSIQHRRVDTMRKFFAAKGASLPITSYPEDYRPGDVVSYYRPQNAHSRTHIAIVSDIVAPSGRLMIVHNRGWGPQLEDALFVDQITGHYRFHATVPASAVAKAGSSSSATAAGAVTAGSVQKRAAPAPAPASAPAPKTVVKAAYAAAKAPATAAPQGVRNGLPNGPQ